MSAISRLNGKLHGTGDRAMVFVHGLGCEQRMWRYVAPHFETEFVTVLIDLVGSGASDCSAYSADKYSSLQGYAHDIIELGHEVGFEDAVLVGHSCGAMIGLLASIEDPAMFESLVLLSASPRYINDKRYAGGFTQQAILTMLRDLRTDYGDWSQNIAPVFMGNAHRPELADELLRSFRRTDPEIVADFATAIYTSDWRTELSKVKASCLVIQCEADPFVPLGVGRYLSSQIPGAQFETIPTDGHFPHLSAPERVVESIRQFVSLKPLSRSNRIPSPAAGPAQDPHRGGSLGLNILGGIWSRRPPSLADQQGRAQLEELLLQRAGELMAHLGRYDMHALALETWLRSSLGEIASRQPAMLRTRGAHIKALLQRTAVEGQLVLEFEAIDRELVALLSRHEIAAKNMAIVPALALHANRPPPYPKEWYEFDAASDQELLFFIDAIERDVLAVAALCLRLCHFADSLAAHLRRVP